FGEHQALAGIGAVEAASRQVVEQRFVVELRIVSAQGELEAVLPLGGAMARPSRADDFVENRRDVTEERHTRPFDSPLILSLSPLHLARGDPVALEESKD